jgi:RecA-family ATPase
MLNGYSTAQALDALHFLDSGVDRETWRKLGFSGIAAGLTIDQLDAWSATADNYKGTQDVHATFRNVKLEGGTGPGTLFKLAKEAGWTANGNSQANQAPERMPKPVEPPRKPAPGMGATEIWQRCEAATEAHPCIVKKGAAGVPLDNLKVVPAGDSLTIQGERMAGALVVPVMQPGVTLSSLQFITPPETAARLKAKGKPDKLNLPEHALQGGWFTVGELVPGGVTYIVEGIGTAWACWQATGAAAVVCFGAGNMGKVAKAMRERDPSARLVMVPDVGKEKQAAEIAAAVSGMVAAMPDGWEQNSDVHDLAQRDGMDVLALLLEAATEPPKSEPKVHPLARFVDFDGTAKAPRWVIPGVIGHGVVVIAGAHGVGKTTALLPLAMTAAGLHGGQLMPHQWRHVVYVTEDVEQARRIMAGIVGYSNLGISLEPVRERLHIVEALRLDPAYVAQVGKTYREQFTRVVDGVEVLPLVVLDTKSAVLALDNENDNSEASAMMAALKQGFDGLPVWLIGHVAKPNIGRADVTGLTSRGASAIEGDANQTLFLVREGESRYLVLGKTRFEPRWPELEITSYTAQAPASDEYGNLETIIMRWGVAAPAEMTRKEAAEQAAEQQRKEDAATLRQDIRDAIETAWQTGNPLNRAGIKAKIPRQTALVGKTIENLLSEQWLYEVPVPAKIRICNSKAAYLVSFTTLEHEALVRGDGLPSAKMVIPASWQKPSIALVPEVDGEAVEVDHA